MIHIPGNLLRDNKDRRGQDGRRGGCGAHLPSTNTSKAHLHMKQFSRKTGNWQKNSYKTKAIIKIHT